MVPEARLELARLERRGILNPLCETFIDLSVHLNSTNGRKRGYIRENIPLRS